MDKKRQPNSRKEWIKSLVIGLCLTLLFVVAAIIGISIHKPNTSAMRWVQDLEIGGRSVPGSKLSNSRAMSIAESLTGGDAKYAAFIASENAYRVTLMVKNRRTVIKLDAESGKRL